ncbi:hypothetical protein NT01EI_1382 [Edwardsiella ictaluri 93-146]|uniref:Uncharacterized protein n=1 Tax=Edwardsiella ictaluri (strain 93-146) TaxID=634503 RepID=C5BD77_EDWI9|nr:hypothetical protein NT01EI_1382 [Edwardsiella ictaluri 93-146]
MGMAWRQGKVENIGFIPQNSVLLRRPPGVSCVDAGKYHP